MVIFFSELKSVKLWNLRTLIKWLLFLITVTVFQQVNRDKLHFLVICYFFTCSVETILIFKTDCLPTGSIKVTANVMSVNT